VVEILQSVNNGTQSLREIAYYAWLLLRYIVINTIFGRLTTAMSAMSEKQKSAIAYLIMDYHV